MRDSYPGAGGSAPIANIVFKSSPPSPSSGLLTESLQRSSGTLANIESLAWELTQRVGAPNNAGSTKSEPAASSTLARVADLEVRLTNVSEMLQALAVAL